MEKRLLEQLLSIAHLRRRRQADRAAVLLKFGRQLAQAVEPAPDLVDQQNLT